MNSKIFLTTFFNTILTCALLYGIVAAIGAKDIMWAIAYSATLLKQLLHILSLHETTN